MTAPIEVLELKLVTLGNVRGFVKLKGREARALPERRITDVIAWTAARASADPRPPEHWS